MRRVNEGWVLMGWLFGYPKCCVEYFATYQFLKDGRPTPAILAGTGFIACPVCAATHTDDEMIAIINKNRKVDYSFTPHLVEDEDELGETLLKVLYEDRAAAVPTVAERSLETSPSPL